MKVDVGEQTIDLPALDKFMEVVRENGPKVKNIFWHYNHEVDEAFENEIELKNGQIYKDKRNRYCLLMEYPVWKWSLWRLPEDSWSAMPFFIEEDEDKYTYMCQKSYRIVADVIKEHLTLCPDAELKIIEKVVSV